MTPYHATPDATFFVGDCRAVLGGLDAGSAHMAVCSPPYWGLRDYGIAPTVWGGSDDCTHEWGATIPGDNRGGSGTFNGRNGAGEGYGRAATRGSLCLCCDGWRGVLGLEPIHDCLGWARGENCGRCFLCHLRDVFAAVRRVLRDDATCWVNLGDSYAGSGKGPTGHNGIGDQGKRQGFVGGDHPEMDRYYANRSKNIGGKRSPDGLKQKDLVLIPQRFALAMQADGWYVRSQIIWAKKATMPESVTDRPTSAHETIWLLTKRPTYYYDADAVREASDPEQEIHNRKYAKPYDFDLSHEGNGQPGNTNHVGLHARPGPGGRNMRNVWHLGPEPFPEAHFATFVTEIPRRAILAGTSEWGVCAECGAPWERVTEKVAVDGFEHGDLERGKAAHWKRSSHTGSNDNARWRSPATLGWAKSCRCPTDARQPAVVLDCFGGSGTTSVVARQLGRRSIYCDASPEYAAMAVRRLEGITPTLPTPSPRPPPATQLALGEAR